MSIEQQEFSDFGDFNQREKLTSAMFSAVSSRIADRDDLRLDAAFHLVEELIGQKIVSPILIRGEVLEYGLNDDNHPSFKIIVFEETAFTEDLPFEPPQDFLPEEPDDIKRIVDWHNTVRVDLEPQHLIRQLRYGDVFGLILSTRRV